MPELPDARRRRFVEQYALPEYDAGQLTQSRALADYFEATVARRRAAEGGEQLDHGRAGAHAEGRRRRHRVVAARRRRGWPGCSRSIEKGTISGSMAKDVFEKMFALEPDGRRRSSPPKGWRRSTTSRRSSALIADVLAKNADAVGAVPRRQDQRRSGFSSAR